MRRKLTDIIDLHREWVESSGQEGLRAVILNENLRFADLSGVDLRGASFAGCNLYHADFCGSDLRGARLSESNLFGANLTGTNLADANLGGANLFSANLNNANLFGADLRMIVSGNLKEIKTIAWETWPIIYCPPTGDLAIGCYQHCVEEWQRMSDQEIIDLPKLPTPPDIIGFRRRWNSVLQMLGVFDRPLDRLRQDFLSPLSTAKHLPQAFRSASAKPR